MSDKLINGWFTEFSPDDLANLQKISNPNAGNKQMKLDGIEFCGSWTGQAFSLAVEKVLFEKRSKYQDVLVFKSKSYGKVLVLDGVIQTTDRDEFAYQEMLTHLPLFSHSNPKNVLIIGGGDGGIVREALKHPSVEKVTLCEIDEVVVEAALKFLPNLSHELKNPKLTLFIGDGFDFLKKHKNEFDVIITDSSDPVGPAESLFGKSYYALLNEALKSDGILASQAESLWLHLELIKQMIEFTRQIFPSVYYAWSSMPTYPSGSMGYLLASKTKGLDISNPVRKLNDEEVKRMNLKFYNSNIHKSAFYLPNFVKDVSLYPFKLY